MSDKVTELLAGEWAHLGKLVNEAVVQNRDWYRRKAGPPMRLFRGLGATVILMSFGISALSFFDGKGGTGRDLTSVIFILSLLISAVTAYISFFQLQETWRSRRTAELKLSSLLVLWRLDLSEAADEPDVKIRTEKARIATRQCVESAALVIGSETNEFFSKMPSGKDLIGPSKA